MDSPIQNQSVVQQNIPSKQKNKMLFNSVLGLVGFLVLALLLEFFNVFHLPFLSSLPHYNRKTNTIKIQQNTVIATVGNQRIYLIDIKNEARKLYLDSGIDQGIMRRTLSQMIEKKILDLEAQKMNISVQNQEIHSKLATNRTATTSASSPSKALIEALKYQTIKDKIMSTQVKSVQAYIIGFWVPDLSYPQQPLFDKQRAEGKKLLNEAETRLKKGDAPIKITEDLYKKYPILQPRLALNGAIFGKTLSQNVFTSPKLYVLNRDAIDKSSYVAEFYDVLEKMKKGDVKQVLYKDLSGGDTIQIVETNNSKYTTYDEWFIDKKKELVTIYVTL